jgi:hypothetical protein
MVFTFKYGRLSTRNSLFSKVQNNGEKRNFLNRDVNIGVVFLLVATKT